LGIAGGGCLLVIAVFVALSLFATTQLRRESIPPHTGLVSTPVDEPFVRSTPTDKRPAVPTLEPFVEPTPEPEDTQRLPSELVGQWAYSDENGSWLYIFSADGSYQRVFEHEMVALGCSVKIARYEAGLAALERSTLTLSIQSGEKTTTDSCDSSRNASRDLAGTSEIIALEAEFDGDHIISLYVDNMPFRPFSNN
jgi:hypothetical protein